MIVNLILYSRGSSQLANAFLEKLLSPKQDSYLFVFHLARVRLDRHANCFLINESPLSKTGFDLSCSEYLYGSLLIAERVKNFLLRLPSQIALPGVYSDTNRGSLSLLSSFQSTSTDQKV